MRQRGAVRIGCGARFAGDRRNAALRLLLQVPDMHYLVLECRRKDTDGCTPSLSFIGVLPETFRCISDRGVEVYLNIF